MTKIASPRSVAFEAAENTGSNTSANPTIGDLIAARFSRRDVLQGLAAVSVAAELGWPAALAAAPNAAPAAAPSAPSAFDFTELAVQPNSETHHVAEGYDADVLIRWGDSVLPDAPAFDPTDLSPEAQARQFGYNNDFIAFFPLDGRSDHGLLVVNHEYTNGELMFPGLAPRSDKDNDFSAVTRAIVDTEMMAHGGSVIEIRRERGKWQVVASSTYARRITADTVIAVSGPAAGHHRLETSADPTGTRVKGMLNNCAGGVTPWGTWLTCEEIEGGRVLECDPTTPNSGHDLPALGRFVHEAVAVDPRGKALYLTEDRPDGLFYRFTPARWPQLDEGVLEAVAVDPSGAVRWLEVPDRTAATTPTRHQDFGATAFSGGEGIAFGNTPEGRRIWFTTKGDNVVRELDPAAWTMREIYRATETSSLHGVDNLWWDEPSQRLFVAEDGDDMQLVALDQRGRTAPLLQVTGHDGSEITGPALNPQRTTLHCSSQRGVAGTNAGVTYAVTGPFPPTT
jgi:secreted PhoX family phosphatase